MGARHEWETANLNAGCWVPIDKDEGVVKGALIPGGA